MSRTTLGLDQAVADYVLAANRDEHPALKRCRAETDKRPDANMQIGAEQGAVMAFLAKAIGARTYLEIGAFTGYSALVMALAMQESHGEAARVIACDISEEFFEIARDYWREAGVEALIETRAGPALDSLSALSAEGAAGTVDLAFIDADKENYAAYYDAAMALLRPGGVLLLDNVLWSGKVADPSSPDPVAEIMRKVAAKAREDARADHAFAALGDGLLMLRKR